MKKVYKLLLFLGVCVFAWQVFLPNANAQVKSINWDFNDSLGVYTTQQYGNWSANIDGGSNSTIELVVDDTMTISYNKQTWSFIQIWNPNIDFVSAPYMSFKVRSDSAINLKMVLKDYHDSVLTEYINLPAGGDWQTVEFDYWAEKISLDTVIKEIQFDPGWIVPPDSLFGVLYFDDFMMGEILRPEEMLTMAPYAYVMPKIDGTVDGIWGQVKINQETVANVTDGGTMGNGFEATFKTLWDEEALYVLVEVADDTAMWNYNEDGDIAQDQSDYVDVYVDLDMAFPHVEKKDNGSWWNYYDQNDYQIKFLRDSAWTDVGTQLSYSWFDTASVEFAVAEVMDGDLATGWVVEAKFPWDSLGTFMAANDALVGFEVTVGDANTNDDSLRDGRASWYNTLDNNWEDPRLWGVLKLFNEGLPVENSFFEDFEAPVDMDFWNPGTKLGPDPVFTITQEDGALHILMEQTHFADGQMYTFTDKLFDLSENPYASMKIKVDSGLFRDWDTTPLDWIPFQLGPFSIDGVREHAIKHNLKPDGQWKRIYFDWSIPSEHPNNYELIDRLLFESVTWPTGDSAYFWIDDFNVGAGVKLATDIKSMYGYVMPVIDGEVDNVWKNLEGVEGDSVLNVTAGTMDEDFAATFKTIWDKDALYVLVEIQDSVPFWNVDEDEMIKQDHSDYVDIYVDLDRYFLYKEKKDNGSWWNFYDNNDYQFKFLRDSNWFDVGTQLSFDWFDTASVTFEVAEVDGGWLVEAMIPWDSLGVFTPANNMKIGFDIVVGDADDAGADSTRKGRYAWKNTMDNDWEDPEEWGILQFTGEGKQIVKTWSEDFDGETIDLEFFNAYMDSSMFLITHEENALHIELKQSSFANGQFYEFDDFWFDLTLVPYASMKIKVDEASWTDWQELPQDWVPMQLGPWSPDNTRQHADNWPLPIDGEWYDIYYDWSTDSEHPNEYGVISKFLFESVTWPRADTADFWIDDFAIGIAAAKATKVDSLDDLTVDMGTLDPEFAPATMIYQVELPAGTTATPTVTATCSDANSTVVVTPAADVASAAVADRTTTVVVTAQDWRLSKTYKVIFSVLPDAIPEVLGDFMLYPNPAADVLYLSNALDQRMMTITNVLGQRVMTEELTGDYRYAFNVSDLENGVYVVNVKDVNGNVYTRRIVIE